jgi:hypothetical protein
MLLALAASSETLALGELAEVSVVDRDSGATLTTYFHGGEYWVAGRTGARYGIQIRNATRGRLLAVMSVDGINILTGATAGWDQQGYVLSPRIGYLITGWRKSNEEVAAFTFTASQGSYAELTGRPANVGVLGVALFRERPQSPPISRASDGAPADRSAAGVHSGAGGGGPAGGPASGVSARATGEMSPEPKRSEPKLGTGHGERESSPVTLTSFERLQEEPNEIVRIHYDSLSNLIAMGIVPAPPHGTPEAFPASQPHYVPDPPPQP